MSMLDSRCGSGTCRLCRLTFGAAALAAAFACSRSGAEETTGGVPASVVVGRAPPAVDGIRSVVTLSPDPPEQSPVPAEPAIMDQFAIAFVPRLLVARQGQPVEFRNSEEVSHNVRVVETATDSMIFSVNPVIGDPYVHNFDRPGLYAVACDIHPGMTGHVVIVREPHAVVAAEDGSFTVGGVPSGRYRLRVWSVDSALASEQVVEIGTDTTELRLGGD